MKKAVLAAVVLLCLAATGPAAAYTTGNDILKWDSVTVAYYVMGALETYQVFEGDRAPLEIPEEATWDQLADIFVKYVKDHPEDRHLPAPWLLLSSVGVAFDFAKVGTEPAPSPTP